MLGAVLVSTYVAALWGFVCGVRYFEVKTFKQFRLHFVDVQALKLDPSYWPALESLENVKSLAVDRWHYRMLNHSARNEAYARAIGRAVKSAAFGRDISEVGQA